MTPEQDKALTMMQAIINATGATFEDEELAISIMSETLKIRFKPLEWEQKKTYKSAISSIGEIVLYRSIEEWCIAIHNMSTVRFKTEAEAKEYAKMLSDNNVLKFILI